VNTIRIERGQPTAEEVAALVIAVEKSTRPSTVAAESPRSRWADKALLLRKPPARGWTRAPD
jgi:hypothetical protein